MRRVFLPFALAAVVVAHCSSAWAEPVFVNGLVFPGNTLDATQQPGANGGRLGFFSDIYYDPNRDEWWAVSDRVRAAACWTTPRACSGSRSTCTR